MPLDRPIVILGAGRTGSTIFHRILREHPRVAWLTKWADRKPAEPARNGLLMRAADWPLVGAWVGRSYPAESYGFWEHHSPGFRHPCRDLVATDVSERGRSRLRSALEQVPTRKRSRLSLKVTGWPRIGFLREIFPDARFIHVMRDGRSVANSLLNVSWWWGWRGPENWRWGSLDDAYMEEWRRHGRSFVALAGIQWKLFIDALEEAKPAVPEGQFLEVRYEDLCADTHGTFEQVVDFCQLERSPRFDRAVASFRLTDTSDKWRRHLSERQRDVLTAVLGDYLERHGYQR